MKQLILVVSFVAAVFAAPPNSKIVGGNATTVEKYKYQCSLLNDGKHICGCFIISPFFAVTAAHCTDYLPIASFQVRVGSSTLDSDGLLVSLDTYHQHPNYTFEDIDYDISVLHLSTELIFGLSIGSIALPELNQEVAPGTPAVVTGWGATAEGGSPSLQLQVVEVPIVSLEQCKAVYAPISYVSENMICAGLFEEGGKDACDGDAGSPLVANGVVVGIVSWGYGCARPQYPGVYSNVAKLRDFIAEDTGL